MGKHMPGYREEAAWRHLDRRFHLIPGADHNYSSVAWSAELIREVVAFVEQRSDWQERTRNAASNGRDIR
jgi:hypothetical protein